VKTIDGHYIDLYGLDLVAGKNLMDLDTANEFVVNQRFAAVVGYKIPADILGKKIKLWGREFPVVGVVKDFHTVSLHSPIEATILFNRISNYDVISVKVNPANMQPTIKQLQIRWEAAYPEFVFSYQFLDEQIKEFYQSEKRMSTLLTLFTTLAILIGCLGLFGLATFMANQKMKEIGIRKVLGASVESIVILFSREYVKLILVGFVFAAPAAFYVMNQWLDSFAYKIEMGPVIFLSGIGLTLVIAIVTVGFRSFQAARVNPAQSLKSE
jgi:ABC-type antimicrobial peptide transport system permease subunit